MAQSAANPLTDAADPISNAVLRPEASLFVRQVLQGALANSAGAAAGWIPRAQALLANVMMNDHLNGWNVDIPFDVNAVQKYITDAINAKPPDPILALAHHAQGLICRAQGTPQGHQDALDAFTRALSCDGGFARAHAQIGNQKVLLGQETNSHGHFQIARSRALHHPATGYFNWGEGRAYFQEKNWEAAIILLNTSVTELPTVWYNRCYLAAAQDATGDATNKAAAQETLRDFRNAPGMPTLAQVKKSLQHRTGDPQTVAEARAKVLAFLP
jgi:tetratricopeptide (TPR) repeat protein